MRRYADLQQQLAYHFRDDLLLERALTHRSVSLQGTVAHMERLEFLGDAVLGLAISSWLHAAFPEHDEGQLSRMRAAVVRKEALYQVALAWRLERELHVGGSERVAGRAGKVKSRSIVANAVEAVIGAVFQDGGWAPAEQLVLRAWQRQLSAIGSRDTRDAKSLLQEWTQGQGWGLPEYQLSDHGAQLSENRFEARCLVRGEIAGRGFGARKKEAERAAAAAAYGALHDR